MNHGLSTSSEVGILLPLILVLLAKFFPAQGLPTTDQSFQELKLNYKNWDRFSDFLFFVLSAMFFYPIWIALRTYAGWHSQFLEPAEVILTLRPLYWCIPAMFLGMACAVPVDNWLLKQFLGKRFSEYIAYISMRRRMDILKAERFLIAFIVIACTVAIYLGLNNYVLLKDNHLIVHGYFSTHETDYKLDGIVGIKTAPRLVAPNGHVVPHREYVISFKDGTAWNTSFIPSEPDPETKRWFVEILSTRSGIPIKEIDVCEKSNLN